MEGISIGAIWKLLTWLPKFVLKRIFTKERLSELILFDVRPRHEYAIVNLGEVATYELWFQMLNLSPFDVELDRASIEFWCGGTIQNSSILERTIIPPGKVETFHIRESLADGHATQIARSVENHNASIEGTLEFNSALHQFTKNHWHLNGVIPRFINANYRLPKHANQNGL